MKARIYFEALGRSAASRHIGWATERARRFMWPDWARHAYLAGYLQQRGSDNG